MSYYKEIALADLAGMIEPEDVDVATPLRPGDEEHAIIVELDGGGKARSIVDGHHRVAGWLRWCRDHEAPEQVLVVAVGPDDDEVVVSAAATPGERQEAALALIYQAAAWPEPVLRTYPFGRLDCSPPPEDPHPYWW